jgi:Asp-tRNA(Asn)/Glu-tRNA(Gln) amidotransferase A subunit family amidase
MDKHRLDLWISPAAVGPAPKGLDSTGDPVMSLPWTQAFKPVVSVPAGRGADGLPMGLQVAAVMGDDEELLYWAADMERLLRE